MATIHALPDNVLLEMFKFYVDEAPEDANLKFPEDAWHTLVHVNQRWRFVVLASPRHLDLHILCTNKNQVEKNLNIWPQLPIAIDSYSEFSYADTSPLPGENNIIAALKHHHRVSKITIDGVSNSLLKRFGAMKEPFPVLTKLEILSAEACALVLPDSFLLGSASRLRTLGLYGISFPALPRLFLSSSGVESYIHYFPPSRHISPEALATSLLVLTRLKSLSLIHQSPPSWTERANPHPPLFTRVILPSLTNFYFKGHSKYLERIVSQIDCPLLNYSSITFSDQLASDTPQLHHFISRTETFKAPHRANIQFSKKDGVRVTLFRREGIVGRMKLDLKILCSRSSWQISAITHIRSSPLPPLPTLECLGICEYEFGKPEWQDNIVNTLWLQLFHPFSSVKNLFLSEKLAQLVAPALQELTGGGVTEVLPALQNIFLQGPEPSETVQEAIGQFIVERQLTNCPVAVHCERDGW